MRIGICSVGTEIVAGDQVDTNAAWLSGRVADLGAEPVVHVAVDDDHDRIVAALRWLLARTDGVIVGGGLGPTPDDLTREAVAAVAGAELEHRPDLEDVIRDRFVEFGATMTQNNLRQALVPRGARAWPPVGTAPGFEIEVDTRPVWVLPGVPWELQRLFDEHVAPAVLRRAGGRATATRIVHVAGMGESAVAQTLADIEREAADAGLHVAYLATRSEIQVKVTAEGDSLEQARARSDPWVARIGERLGRRVAGIDATTLEQTILQRLVDADQTVAVAESATAGQVTARLTDPAGASATVLGGLVVYATAAKITVAGLDPDLLERHPPVSAEVTGALAEAVRSTFGATWGVATTGVAGPDDQDGVPVGQVYWAVAGPDGMQVHGRVFRGDRAAVRGRLATAALEALRLRLVETAP